MSVADAVQAIGVGGFGLALPIISPAWTSGAVPTISADAFGLTLAGGNWLAPMAGQLHLITAADQWPVTLVNADSGVVSGSGTLLSLFPQARVRLERLYARVLEAAPAPSGLAVRPVPAHFWLDAAATAGAGSVNPGVELGIAGTLRIYDARGNPIDPVAVASAFLAIMTAHPPLQQRGWTTAFEAAPPLQGIANLGRAVPNVSSPRLRLHVHRPDGTAPPLASLNGADVDAVAGAGGLYAVTGGIGTTVRLGSGASATVRIGHDSVGRLAQQLAFPARPTGVTLEADFFSALWVDLKPYLLGAPPESDLASKISPSPLVRLDEPLHLLTNGNEVVAAASACISGAPAEALLAAPAIAADFRVPTSFDPLDRAAVRWPRDPGRNGAQVADVALTPQLRDALALTAQWLDRGSPPVVDVVLTIAGLPGDAAVRAYPRRFDAEARTSRGNGIGGVTQADGRMELTFRNPLGLTAAQSQATLNLDLMVVKRDGSARLLGGIAVAISGATSTVPPVPTNGFAAVARRSLCSAGIFGHGTGKPGASPTLSSEAALAFIAANPLEAGRLPGTGRRELLAAGLQAGSWRGVASAGALNGALRSADPRLGNPGAPGGRESQAAGVFSRGGKLAYDIGRAALRRSTQLPERLTVLADTTWGEPAAPIVAASSFAAALLQTVAPACDAPELHALESIIAANPDAVPASWPEFVDWLTGLLGVNAAPSNATGPRAILATELNQLKSSPRSNRLYDESYRTLMAACFGRRDAQWSMMAGIASARRFIYLETPAIGPCDALATAHALYAPDFWKALADRMAAVPALRLMLCVPELPDFGPGYEPFAKAERHRRIALLKALPSAQQSDPLLSRMVVFHPIGFPGRLSGIETTSLVVDDVWALVGASCPRRRGLSLDGAADVAMVQMERAGGINPAINRFRRTLMADRMGARSNAFPAIPDALTTRLADGVDAFHALRDALRAGGQGKLALLDGKEDQDPATLLDEALVNPDGRHYNLGGTLALSLLASASSNW
jgi:hypothetical protein